MKKGRVEGGKNKQYAEKFTEGQNFQSRYLAEDNEAETQFKVQEKKKFCKDAKGLKYH